MTFSQAKETWTSPSSLGWQLALEKKKHANKKGTYKTILHFLKVCNSSKVQVPVHTSITVPSLPFFLVKSPSTPLIRADQLLPGHAYATAPGIGLPRPPEPPVPTAITCHFGCASRLDPDLCCVFRRLRSISLLTADLVCKCDGVIQHAAAVQELSRSSSSSCWRDASAKRAGALAKPQY